MGGHPLTLDFVLSSRNYAREVVKTVTLRVAGVVVPVASLMILDGVLRSIGKGEAALPPPVKELLVAAGRVALAHPRSRQWLVERCVDVGMALASAGSSLIEMVSLLMAMDREAQAKAREHLTSASSLVKPKTRWVRRGRRVTRVRRGKLSAGVKALRLLHPYEDTPSPDSPAFGQNGAQRVNILSRLPLYIFLSPSPFPQPPTS